MGETERLVGLILLGLRGTSPSGLRAICSRHTEADSNIEAERMVLDFLLWDLVAAAKYHDKAALISLIEDSLELESLVQVLREVL